MSIDQVEANGAARVYVVAGASGRSGKRVALGLLRAGRRVRALGRSAERLASLRDAGAEVYVGDFADAQFLLRAFDGADAAYLVNPGDVMARDYRRAYYEIAANFAAAVSASGVKALFVSTIGAHEQRHRGFILTHGDVENALDGARSPGLLYLRAPQFYENLFYFLPASKAAACLASPIAPDAPLDMASNADVADYAIARLLELDFEGRSAIELYGPEVLTMREIAARIGTKVGRPFPAIHVPHAVNVESMVAAGLGRDFATLISDTWDVFGARGLLRAGLGQPCVTAATTIDSFLERDYVPALVRGSQS
jgi:uncharacterized protein YbjT (DUF2867 family)